MCCTFSVHGDKRHLVTITYHWKARRIVSLKNYCLSSLILLLLLVANFARTKWCKNSRKMTETLAYALPETWGLVWQCVFFLGLLGFLSHFLWAGHIEFSLNMGEKVKMIEKPQNGIITQLHWKLIHLSHLFWYSIVLLNSIFPILFNPYAGGG